MNKSLEQTKATEALKRKTQQFEKLQKTAFDEKNRLRDECLKSIQTIGSNEYIINRTQEPINYMKTNLPPFLGELKSKISLLEMKVQEQNDEVSTSRDKISHALAKMTSMESELSSKSARLVDLEEREEKCV